VLISDVKQVPDLLGICLKVTYREPGLTVSPKGPNNANPMLAAKISYSLILKQEIFCIFFCVLFNTGLSSRPTVPEDNGIEPRNVPIRHWRSQTL
jgi:hypothetical protein